MLQDTSSTTGTNMIARARVYLDEPTAVKWSETQLLQFLNDGTIDIAARSQCFQGTESVALLANTVEYTPSTDYIELVAAICNPASGSSWGLKKSSVSKRADSVAGDFDTPEFCYEFGGKVGFFPAYTSVTTETVTAYFSKKPASIAAGGTVPTPEILDKALVYYIVYQALLVDGRSVEASNYANLYMQEIDRYRQDFVGADNDG